MATRREKVESVIKILLDAEASEVIHPSYIEISTEQRSLVTPEEMLVILQGFERIPNCIKLGYRYRYSSENELISDRKTYGELMKLAEAACPEIPDSRDILIQEHLSIIDFTVEFGSDFHVGLRRALEGDILKHTQKSLDAVALELTFDDEALYMKIVEDGKKHKMKNLSKSSIFLRFLKYAKEHQKQPFMLDDIFKRTGYTNYSLLMRLFKDPVIYRAFFKVNGDKGSLVADFNPTYKVLIDSDTSVSKIRKIIS